MSRRKIADSAAVPTPPATPPLLEGLNPEQIEAVQHHLGPLLVVAIAGAGKTTVLVRRIAHLVLELGADPSRILAVTFSKKAADEMNERLKIWLPDSGARVGTWHSLAWEFFRSEVPDASAWSIDDREKYRQVVKDVLGWKGMRWDGADLTTVMQFITLAKARAALPGSQEAQQFAQQFYRQQPCAQRSSSMLCDAYSRAELERQNRRILTFDDMLVEMAHRIRDEECLQRWAPRWDFCLQDEAQDENPVQREIATALARDHRNYMVVGDPGQAVYGFRGSDVSGILSFESAWGAKVVRLHRNYRSGDEVIALANRTLGSMRAGTHLGVTITPERGVPGRSDLTAYTEMDDEGEGVVDKIRSLNEDGVPFGDVLVLYRTNAQSRGIEEAMLSARFPYVVVGGVNFYERREVKDLLAYLRVAAGRGGLDDVRRCINAPFRFLGRAFVDRIESLASRTNMRDGVSWTEIVSQVAGGEHLQHRQRQSALDWCQMIDRMAQAIAEHRALISAGAEVPADPKVETPHPSRLLEDVLMMTKYVSWLQRDEGSESPENNRVSNVRELVRAAERFPTVDELLDYVDKTLDEAQKAKFDRSTSDRITLMSIHRSKGLEWPHVFLIGCNEKILPHSRASEGEALDEERRLFYVATTRACDEIHYSFVRAASVGTKVIPLKPSRFLAEVGLVGAA